MTEQANLEAIPAELRRRPQWVVWQYESRGGKRTKVPCSPTTGRLASTTDPATWGSFDQARGLARQPGVDGVGYVLCDDDPYTGIDLDACMNGDGPHPAVAELVARFGSYTEVSPSGTGLHIFVRARLDGGRNRTPNTPWGGEFETYDRGRFFCMTGNVFADNPIRKRGRELDTTRRELFPAPAPPPRASSAIPGMSDEEVLERARSAKNGSKFMGLWAGDVSGYGGDDSRADMALLAVLGFWTQDPDQLDRLFRRSGLNRPKWEERPDYRQRTIAAALAGNDSYTGTTATPPAATTTSGDDPKLPFRTLAEIMAEIPEEPDWIVPGFIAPSTETLLVGPPKVGKSTLLFRLLAGLENGGRALGLDVRQVSYLLLTEENAYTLQEKAFDFDLRGRGGEALLFQEARGVTWLEVVQEAVERCRGKGHELLIVDTFSRWAGLGGESENHAGSIQEAWKPFAAAKEAGLATTVLHHTRKSGGKHGEGIRGSNAIAALPDILLELARTGGEDVKARVLNANSRYRTTPDALGLTFTGDDYEVTTDIAALRGRGGRQQQVRELLDHGPLTVAELADRLGVKQSAAQEHLRKLVEAGKVYRTGAGKHGEPFVYHAAEEG